MKQLYFLPFTAFFSFFLGNSQTIESFNNFAATSTYSAGSFVGNGAIVYTYSDSRNSGFETADDYSIDEKGLMLRRPSESYLEATFPLGLSSFSFQYRKAFTSATARELEISVNGVARSTTGTFGGASGVLETIFTHTLTINQSGPVVIRIRPAGALTVTTAKQVTIDNITWSTFNLSIDKNTIEGLKVYPNPVTNGSFEIRSNSDSSKEVLVYDILGKQLVKTVTGNIVNVSNLKAGVYIVKISQDGKTATRKLVIQ